MLLVGQQDTCRSHLPALGPSPETAHKVERPRAFHSSLTPEVVLASQEEDDDLAAGHKQSDAQDGPRPHAETEWGCRGQGEASGVSF